MLLFISLDNSIKTSPNPFIEYTYIESETRLKDAHAVLYNLQGKKLKEMHHLNGFKIPIARGNITAGQYQLLLKTSSGQVSNHKIIIVD